MQNNLASFKIWTAVKFDDCTQKSAVITSSKDGSYGIAHWPTVGIVRAAQQMIKKQLEIGQVSPRKSAESQPNLVFWVRWLEHTNTYFYARVIGSHVNSKGT